MSFHSKSFGNKKEESRRTTADNPFRISRPVLGFMNVLGEEGKKMMESDKTILAPLFHNVQTSDRTVPQCHVLFLYGKVGTNGEILNSPMRLRDIIKSAGAYVAVVASENSYENYLKVVQPKNDWTANIVLVINRKGEKFGAFFFNLLKAMVGGTSMLMEWVQLAPQIPSEEQPECPETIMLAEAGHVTLDGLA